VAYIDILLAVVTKCIN